MLEIKYVSFDKASKVMSHNKNKLTWGRKLFSTKSEREAFKKNRYSEEQDNRSHNVNNNRSVIPPKYPETIEDNQNIQLGHIIKQIKEIIHDEIKEQNDKLLRKFVEETQILRKENEMMRKQIEEVENQRRKQNDTLKKKYEEVGKENDLKLNTLLKKIEELTNHINRYEDLQKNFHRLGETNKQTTSSSGSSLPSPQHIPSKVFPPNPPSTRPKPLSQSLSKATGGSFSSKPEVQLPKRSHSPDAQFPRAVPKQPYIPQEKPNLSKPALRCSNTSGIYIPLSLTIILLFLRWFLSGDRSSRESQNSA